MIEKVLRVALLTRNPLGWGTRALDAEFGLKGHLPKVIPVRALGVDFLPLQRIVGDGYDLVEDFDVIVQRLLGPDSLEEVLHTMNLIQCLEAQGQVVVNSEKATRNCLNKYSELSDLSAAGIPIPRTHIVRSVEEGLRAFEAMGDVVIKPIFGSRGKGVVRVTESTTARYVLEEMVFHGHVPLIQEFIKHEGFDIRALVVGDSVVAAMKRVSKGFRTNISKGGTPVPFELDGKLAGLVVKASRALGCDYSGVDLVTSDTGAFVFEVNCQPDYRALQSVTETNISSAIIAMVVKRAAR